MSNIVSRITGTVVEKVGAVKDAVWEKVEDVNFNLDSQEQMMFVKKIAEDEGCSFEAALEMCTPHTPTWQPKYSLGYKMASPAIMASLTVERGKRAFRERLEPQELILFDNDIRNMKLGELLSEEYKRQKKERKEKKKAKRERSFGLTMRKKK